MTLKEFLDNHSKVAQPLYQAMCEAYRNASISGKKEDYEHSEKTQLAYNDLYTNAKDFAILQRLAKEETNWTPLLQRQYDVLYRGYL